MWISFLGDNLNKMVTESETKIDVDDLNTIPTQVEGGQAGEWGEIFGRLCHRFQPIGAQMKVLKGKVMILIMRIHQSNTLSSS